MAGAIYMTRGQTSKLERLASWLGQGRARQGAREGCISEDIVMALGNHP